MHSVRPIRSLKFLHRDDYLFNFGSFSLKSVIILMSFWTILGLISFFNISPFLHCYSGIAFLCFKYLSALFNSVFILRSKGDSEKIHTYTLLHKEFWKRFMFFHWLLWCSMPNFGPMYRGKPCLPDINHCILLFQSKGHQIPYNEAITLQLSLSN